MLDARHLGRGQAVRRLHQQRGEEQLDAFQVGGVAEEVDPGDAAPLQVDDPAAQRPRRPPRAGRPCPGRTAPTTVTTRSPTGSRAGRRRRAGPGRRRTWRSARSALAVNASASAGVHAGSSALASSLRTRASSGSSRAASCRPVPQGRTVEPASASRQSGSWPSAMAAPNRASPVGMSPLTYALTNRATQRLSYRASSIPGKSRVQAPPLGTFCPTIVAARHQATSYAPTTPDRSTTASKVPTTASLSPLSAQCSTCAASSRACCGTSVTWRKVRGSVKKRARLRRPEAGRSGGRCTPGRRPRR